MNTPNIYWEEGNQFLNVCSTEVLSSFQWSSCIKTVYALLGVAAFEAKRAECSTV
jgi:hypothetical protein